ncbi:MAG TPA: alpha/beta fold hydrolase [Jatrophihabitans sp.]|nr:alpha/beta fold hydrolase [Jatrophihabitans sp.]
MTTELPRLLCFPHAGASALAYARWRRELAPVLDVRVLELPGRLGRHAEPLALTMPEVLDSLATQVDALATENCLLYGHSLGALVAFEFARRLAAAGRAPARLVVSGRNGPTRTSPYPTVHTLPSEELLAAVQAMDTGQPGLADEPELVDLFLPVLRADLRVAETYAYSPAASALPCPILSWQGEDDPLVSRDGVQAWELETSASCTIAWLPGQHFFHLNRPEFLVELARAVTRQPARRG